MKKIPFFIVILLGISNFAISQNSFKGNVYEENSTIAIPYAIVKVQNKNIGVVSNEYGKFNLSDQGIEVNDSLIITCLGYKPKSFSVRDWKNDLNIYMKAYPIPLSEATISSKRAKEIKIGITNGGTKTLFIPLFTNKELTNNNLIGREIGTVLNIENYCRISALHIFVAVNKYDNIKMRAIFYSVENGLPKDIIVNSDIIFNVTEIKGWANIDLTKNDIQFKQGQQIAVTLMSLDETNKDQFFIYAKMFSKNGLLRRETVLGDWTVGKGGMSMYLSGYVNYQ
ncbi:MAG: carboxypeptidase-like regulatory domain-containing protein [Bacteroidales bacterium]|nr:carboxypeptidase-like regulatory domain-containing protein [Bacteroidales bacterium]